MKETGEDNLVSKALESVRRRHGLGKRTCQGYERPPERSVDAVMTCPRCGGRLHYTVSSYNGATLGRCRTPGCLRWIE